MSRISPKLIAVQQNRIGDEEFKIGEDKGYDTIQKKNKELGFRPYKDGLPHKKIVKENEVHIGRFPTQLFTNIKNDKYKYVKNIT